jgi:hypothetical protein
MAVMQNVKSKIVLITYCWINICGVKDLRVLNREALFGIIGRGRGMRVHG